MAAKITPKYLGGKSFFRKFVRRNIGLVYKIQTIRGFKFSGAIGDSVDNRIMVYQDYESALSSIIAREAAGTSGFLDVGCNVGWFSCLVASLPNRPKYIIAVDANSEMIDACSSNLKLNGFNAEVLLRAVGPHKGNVTFHVPRLRHSRASLGRANAEQFGDVISYSIEMSPLEELINLFQGGRCDLIKMDIEGYELEALRTVPKEVILKVGIIIMEYTISNLKGCGLTGMTLGALPWLEEFTVQTLDDNGRTHNISNPASYSPAETTFILRNRKFHK